MEIPRSIPCDGDDARGDVALTAFSWSLRLTAVGLRRVESAGPQAC